MKKICHKKYFVEHCDYDCKEVTRDIFLKCLGSITKQEYKMLVNGRKIKHDNICFYIKDEYEIVKDEFDILIKNAHNAIQGDVHCYNRICKVVNGIKCGKINKDNLHEQALIMTKYVRSKNALSNWNNIINWFEESEWF